MGEAEKEARWALDIAEKRSVAQVRYAEAVPDLGPRTPDEADAFVRRVLQPVLNRPDAESRELLATLSSFLEHDRSWQRTAKALHVHRQTVLYRIRKVETLTGLSVSRTMDLATLWVALRALERVPPMTSLTRREPKLIGGEHLLPGCYSVSAHGSADQRARAGHPLTGRGWSRAPSWAWPAIERRNCAVPEDHHGGEC